MIRTNIYVLFGLIIFVARVSSGSIPDDAKQTLEHKKPSLQEEISCFRNYMMRHYLDIPSKNLEKLKSDLDLIMGKMKEKHISVIPGKKEKTHFEPCPYKHEKEEAALRNFYKLHLRPGENFDGTEKKKTLQYVYSKLEDTWDTMRHKQKRYVVHQYAHLWRQTMESFMDRRYPLDEAHSHIKPPFDMTQQKREKPVIGLR
nr:PREDICTED: uncharacterized protein LOC109035438 [Bemisia tabaci]